MLSQSGSQCLGHGHLNITEDTGTYRCQMYIFSASLLKGQRADQNGHILHIFDNFRARLYVFFTPHATLCVLPVSERGCGSPPSPSSLLIKYT